MIALLWWAADAGAQAPCGFSSGQEQWQLTLDAIKAKAQTLLIENNAIQGQSRQLIDEEQKLRQAIKNEQDKNEAMRLFLNQRHGRTDEQMQLEQLKQAIRTKRQQARISEGESAKLKRKPAAPADYGTLTDLRKRLEEEKRQEAILENELSILKRQGDPYVEKTKD